MYSLSLSGSGHPTIVHKQTFQLFRHRILGCLAGVWVPSLKEAVREIQRLVRELQTSECLSAADAELVHSVLRALNFLRRAASCDAAWPSQLAGATAQGAQLLASAMRALAQLLQVQAPQSSSMDKSKGASARLQALARRQGRLWTCGLTKPHLVQWYCLQVPAVRDHGTLAKYAYPAASGLVLAAEIDVQCCLRRTDRSAEVTETAELLSGFWHQQRAVDTALLKPAELRWIVSVLHSLTNLLTEAGLSQPALAIARSALGGSIACAMAWKSEVCFGATLVCEAQFLSTPLRGQVFIPAALLQEDRDILQSLAAIYSAAASLSAQEANDTVRLHVSLKASGLWKHATSCPLSSCMSRLFLIQV